MNNRKITVRELLELSATDDRSTTILLYDEDQQAEETILECFLLQGTSPYLQAWLNAEVEYWLPDDNDTLVIKAHLLETIPTRTVLVNITEITTKLVEVAVPEELDEQAAHERAKRDVEIDYCNGKIDMTVDIDHNVEYDIVNEIISD